MANATSYPPTPGWHCSYCPIAVRCAKRTALVAAEAMIDNDDSATAAVGRVVVLEAALKNQKKQLQEYAKRAAPVSLPDGTTAGYDTKESIVLRNVEGLVETLGIEAAIPYLSVNNRKTKKLQNDAEVAHLFESEFKSAFKIANRKALALPAGLGGDEDEEDEE
jgi:hypothetical protein